MKKKLQRFDQEGIFWQFFHGSPDGLSISRLSDGVFIEVNKGFELLTGFKREELIGRSVFETGMWTDRSIRNKLGEVLLQNGSYKNLESDFMVKGGEVRRGLVSATIMSIKDEPHMLAVARDITHIRSAEKDLINSQQKYEELIQFAPDGIVVLNKSGELIMVNPAFIEITGYAAHEILNRNFRDFPGFMEKPQPKYLELFDRLLEGVVPKPFEIRFWKKTGEVGFMEIHITPLRQDGKITGSQAIVRDITDRVKAIESLRLSEGQYRTSLDSMHDSIYVVNGELEIILANKALIAGLENLGLPGEVTGKTINEAFPFLPADVNKEYHEVLKTGKVIQKEDKYRLGEHEYYTQTRLTPIFEEEKVTRVITVVQDISERKRVEKVEQIIYNISNAVNLTKDVNELFQYIQNQLGEFFDTRNFFIAFYNKEDDTLSLPFFVDEKDSFDSFPAKKTLTGYMIRNDRAVLMTNTDIDKLIKSGEIDDVGAPSKIWLGVPLKIKDEIIGAIVVQSYEDENAFSEKDLETLKFVSSQISLSVETKRAYDEIQIEKAYFAQLFEGAPETIVLTDKSGKLIRVNSEFEKLFGYSQEEVIGKLIDTLIVPGELISEAKDISSRVAKGEKILTETVRMHKDGRRIHVSVLGTPIEIGGGLVAVYGIYRDITERKKTELALKESEEKIRNILYSSPDAITVSDLKGNIFECNQAAIEVFGVKSEKDLIGINARLLIKRHHWEKGIHQLKQVIRNGFVRNIEFEIQNQNNHPKYVEVSASLFKNPNGKPIGIVATTKDISERMEYEKNLREAKEKAEQSDRLKSSFLANMSHEIRTPMNAILGFSELLKNEHVSKNDRDEYIRIINNKGNELLLIINDIIDISKIEAGDITITKSEIHVNTFLEKLHRQFSEEKKLLDKGHIYIRLNIQKDKNPIIKSDEARLRQVLNNLVNNALKFTHEGYIEMGYSISGKTLDFFVRDTGIGISKEYQEIIFDRFRQVDESLNSEFGGTGLGLAISKNLLSLLGGDIRVESEVGHGSCFYFSLPLMENRKGLTEDDENDYNQTNRDQNLDLTGKKILIAEDDSANYLFIESFLKRTNCSVLWVKDGDRAVETLKTEKGIDMILMDLRMPNLNGIDATRLIREFNRDVPIIALTAHAFEDDRNNSIKAGCNDYLSKPVKLEQLSEILAAFLS